MCFNVKLRQRVEILVLIVFHLLISDGSQNEAKSERHKLHKHRINIKVNFNHNNIYIFICEIIVILHIYMPHGMILW